MGIFDFLSGMGGSAPQNPADLKDKKLVVLKSRCPQNHPCPSVRVCPVNALVQKGYAAPVVDESKCVKCGKCVRYCPMRAIQFQ